MLSNPSPDSQEPNRLSGEIGAFSVSRHFGIPCDLAHVRPIVIAARDFLASQGVDSNDLFSCELALAEACNNAIRYAPASRRHLPIDIQLFCESSRLEMHVVDHTHGFDWPEQIDLPSPERESGRGLYIMQSVMNHVLYLRGSAENRLILRKTLKADRAGMTPPTSQELQRKLALSEEVIGTMAKELCFRSEALAAIFRCTSELGKTSAVEEFWYQLLNDLLKIVAADWFILRLVPKNDPSHLVFTKSSQAELTLEPVCIDLKPNVPANIGSGRARSRRISGVSTGSRICAELRAATLRTDVFFGPQNPLAADDPLSNELPRSVGLVQPIARSDMLLGTLAIGRFDVEKPFTVDQVEVIYTFCEFLAIQIINNRLQKEQVELRLTAHELDIARNIQQSLLPKTFPSLPGFGLAGFCLSARQVGGDFYDVLPLPNNQALLIVADVMGKGVPAALFAATLHTLVHTTTEWTHSPSELLARMNRLLFEELSGVDMFITVQLALADVPRNRLVIANAGHCPLITINSQGELKIVSPDGLPLGIRPNVTYEQIVLPLDDCSRTLLYTDGLTEARNSHGDLFSQERLCAWLRQSVGKHKTATNLSESLLTELKSFQSQAGLSDDQTLLILADETNIPAKQRNPDVLLPAPTVAAAAK